MNAVSTTSSVLRSAIMVVLAGAVFAMADVDAEADRIHNFSATAVCAGPIPSSDEYLRRSPLGIRNDGASNVFISCSMHSDFVGDTNTGDIAIFFRNYGTSTATIDCTLVAGNRYSGYAFEAGSGDVPAAGDGAVSWYDIDRINSYGTYNFSCILPPDVEINFLFLYETDVGGAL